MHRAVCGRIIPESTVNGLYRWYLYCKKYPHYTSGVLEHVWIFVLHATVAHFLERGKGRCYGRNPENADKRSRNKRTDRRCFLGFFLATSRNGFSQMFRCISADLIKNGKLPPELPRNTSIWRCKESVHFALRPPGRYETALKESLENSPQNRSLNNRKPFAGKLRAGANCCITKQAQKCAPEE